MKQKQDIKTAWEIVKVDDSQYWREDVRAMAGRIFTVYLRDANSRTYCCSLTPSAELNFIRSEFDGSGDADEAEYEELEDAIRGADADAPLVDYMNETAVDAAPFIDGGFPEGRIGRIRLPHLDGEEFEEALDYVNGNWI